MDIGKLKSLLEAIELMEYKREITASKMKSNILSGLEKDTELNRRMFGMDDEFKVDVVLSKLENIDPTNNKQFVPWLAKNYGLFKFEDTDIVNDALTNFVRFKTQISRQGKAVDIGQYNWNTFKSMIDEVTKVDVGNTSEHEKLDYKNANNIDVLYSGTYGKLMVPKTKAASCEIGSGTKWCTAARKDNMFGEYNSEGKLYIWIDKSGDKYQFHFEKEEYKDSVNRDIEQDKMKYFVNEHPVLSKFFSKIAPKYPLFSVKYMNNPDKDVQLAAVNQDGYAIKYIVNPDKDVQMAAVKQETYSIKYIDNPDKDVQMVAVKLFPYTIGHIKNPDKDVQMVAVKQKGRAIADIKNPHKDVQLVAVKNYFFAINYIDNPDKDVQMAAVKHDGEVIKFINNPDKDVQIAAIKNKGYDDHTEDKFSPEVIQWAKENGYI